MRAVSAFAQQCLLFRRKTRTLRILTLKWRRRLVAHFMVVEVSRDANARVGDVITRTASSVTLAQRRSARPCSCRVYLHHLDVLVFLTSVAVECEVQTVNPVVGRASSLHVHARYADVTLLDLKDGQNVASLGRTKTQNGSLRKIPAFPSL